MAHVMIEGGFPEEAPGLIAKALGKLGASVLARRFELGAAADTVAADEIRRLVHCRALPPEALSLLDELADAKAPRMEEASAFADRFQSILNAVAQRREAAAA
jgi:hypothetical protein